MSREVTTGTYWFYRRDLDRCAMELIRLPLAGGGGTGERKKLSCRDERILP